VPEYTIITARTSEFEYKIPINLPLDMGEDTERLTDIQVRKAYDNGALDALVATEAPEKETDDQATEKIIAIFRGNKQLIPRLRKKPVTKAAFDTGRKAPTLDQITDPVIHKAAEGPGE